MATHSALHGALAVALALPAVLLSCAGGTAYLAADAPAPADLQRLLLVPMNFDLAHLELQQVPAALQLEVRDYLERTGHEVRVVELGEVVQHWRELSQGDPALAAGVGEPLGEEQLAIVRSELARRLAAAHGVDAVVMSSLVIRDGYHSGLSLRWDGVSRPVRVQSDSTMETQRISGRGKGTSLRMALHTPDGRCFFERYVGLEPLIEWRMAGFGSAGGGRISGVPRTDLFRDAAIIDEAVEQSFQPLIEPPAVAAGSAD